MRLDRCGVTVLRSLASLAFIAGCDWMPGRPTEAERPVRPSQVTSFDVLYGQHCAGCHGANGNLGPALALKDPLYQALVTEEGLRKVIAQGVPGTMMPGFARKAGGVLTDKQINILAHEMKARWGRPREFANVKVPPYSLQEAMAEGSDRGDPQRGARVYAKYCARCHGKDGTGGPKGGSVVDGSYLALVSDQALRTVAITGRRDLGKPDWRDNTPGPPMTTQEINDVVAWLVSHRQVFPGRPYAGR